MTRHIYMGAVAVALLLAEGQGCTDTPSDPVAEVPDLAANQDVVADVQGMVETVMSGWWRAAHDGVPGAALSTAADAHTSSWRNWGMLAVSSEPRHADFETWDEEWGLLSTPWIELNRTLMSTRDILLAVDAGVTFGDAGAETPGVVAYTKFVQGLTLATLAELFHDAFVIDESVDPTTVELSPYPDVMAAALAELADAIDVASGETFTIPAAWVGFDRDLDREGLVRLVRSMRARLTMAVARDPAERQAVDWASVLDDARNGITQDWGGRYDGDWEHNWADAMDKLAAGVHPAWARLDYRMIGPADASGTYQAWLAAAPADRRPFLIDTDDRRITGERPDVDGTLVSFAGEPIFRPQRGYDHFSFYADRRWSGYLAAWGEEFAADFPVEELSFIEAEALYRTGDRSGAMEIVNRTRTAAGLPAFTDATGHAPGGARCVPRTATGECGDLWDALAYEKRIELFHYGPFTEFTDDRGWGDLVPGTFLDLPAPDASPQSMLEAVYGIPPQSAAALANDLSANGLRAKRAAYRAFDSEHNHDPGDLAGS